MRCDEIDSVNEICALHNLASVHRAGHALVATYALEQHVIQQHVTQQPFIQIEPLQQYVIQFRIIWHGRYISSSSTHFSLIPEPQGQQRTTLGQISRTILRPFWNQSGTNLEPICDDFGTTLGPLWDSSVALWDQSGITLVPLWEHSGNTLG